MQGNLYMKLGDYHDNNYYDYDDNDDDDDHNHDDHDGDDAIGIMIASPWMKTSSWWGAGTERHCL